VDEIARIWSTTWDGTVRHTDGEVAESLVVGIEELAERLERDPFVPDSRALVWPLLHAAAG
jgi:hypothetical protein